MNILRLLLQLTILEGSFGRKLRNLLFGQHLKASMYHIPPATLFVRNSTGHIVGYSGQIFELFDWMSKRLHFTYSIVPRTENGVGRNLGNGTWTGLLGEMIRKEVDISLGPVAPTLERFSALDFVVYIGGSSCWLVIKYPDSRLSDSAVFEPYPTQLWLLWLSSIVLVGIIALVVVYIREEFTAVRDHFRQIDAMFVYLLGTMSGQGGYYRTANQSIRFITAIWCFTAFCFINFYNSILTSRLSAHYQFPEIKSLGDLANKPKYQLVTLRGSVWDLDFLSAKTGTLGIIGERYRKCGQPCSLRTVPEVMEKPMEGDYIAYIAYSYAAGMLYQDYQKNRKCRMTLGSIDYGWVYSFMAIPRHSPYAEEFHRESLWAKAYGFHEINSNWPALEYSFPQQCALKYNSRGVAVKQFSVPIKMIQIHPAFILLLAGLGSALIQFLFENLYGSFQARRRTEIQIDI